MSHCKRTMSAVSALIAVFSLCSCSAPSLTIDEANAILKGIRQYINSADYVPPTDYEYTFIERGEADQTPYQINETVIYSPTHHYSYEKLIHSYVQNFDLYEVDARKKTYSYTRYTSVADANAAWESANASLNVDHSAEILKGYANEAIFGGFRNDYATIEISSENDKSISIKAYFKDPYTPIARHIVVKDGYLIADRRDIYIDCWTATGLVYGEFPINLPDISDYKLIAES